jgi:osmoprotectant transport system ATP-binding protein
MAADPAILLMDEPFGAIDAITRTRLQDELLRIQSQVHKTVLFVTHDVEEALKLADVLVVMSDGHIVQAGPPREILAHPATPFVAQLVGAGDILRQLSLVPVTEIMQRLDPASSNGNGRRLGPTGSARDALVLLLGSGTSRVTVVGEDGSPLGVVTLEDVQTLAEQETPAR